MIYYNYYIPKRKQSNVKNYCIHPDFFRNIDTPEKAYFLGLLMSDGYISKTLYSKDIGIALQASDKYILEHLNNIISPKKYISKYKNSFKWKISSEEMYSDLLRYGIVENKSHSEYSYPNIPENLDNHFIRGYFDGDGCITVKSSGYIVISFCGNSYKFLTDLSRILLKYNILTRPIYTDTNRKTPFHTLYLKGGENKLVFKDFLYKNADIYLTRKYEKFMKIPC